ncbi:hypothetical protein ADK67_02095 [Saccharothrix sp. NRRL B-16348]|uniref:hypothetical protein n=1 Tax=Saccharothrix sp. NRRL B-16348 TaxID=1415542 RepID=UPI0006AF3990|nr:hypothetical protein [Saccharothrix sp. NRRL B-16348]KOX35242.1 hypothetical protein ADK67_02095 [Saccharothrix sp. NRRL B-16348]
MNLRKTIAGAAVTLGSTAVMLGLGGTAQAVDLGAHTRPDVDGELGQVANLGDLVRVDLSNPAGPIVTGPLVLGDGTTDGPLDVKIGLGR